MYETEGAPNKVLNGGEFEGDMVERRLLIPVFPKDYILSYF